MIYISPGEDGAPATRVARRAMTGKMFWSCMVNFGLLDIFFNKGGTFELRMADLGAESSNVELHSMCFGS